MESEEREAGTQRLPLLLLPTQTGPIEECKRSNLNFLNEANV